MPISYSDTPFSINFVNYAHIVLAYLIEKFKANNERASDLVRLLSAMQANFLSFLTY